MEILWDLRQLLQFPVVYTHTTAKGSEWAPTPSSTAKILSKRDGHLEAERVWHMAICDIFDERRAAPPAYGRRAWSKVVSYLRVFRDVFRYWSQFRRRLKTKNVPKYRKLVKNYVGAVAKQLLWFWNPKRVDVERCSKNVFLDRLFQMAPRASWNNPICT